MFHIRCLVINFIYRYFPEVIERGYLYVGEPPLYRIREDKNTNIYLKQHSDYVKYLEKKIRKLYKINNYSLYDLLYNKDEFLSKLKIIQKKYSINNDIIDNICYYSYYYEEELTLEDIVQMILEDYRELEYCYNEKDELCINGFIGTSYQNIILDDEFMSDIEELASFYDKYVIEYEYKGETKTETISDLLTKIDEINIEVSRFKGLGEMDADELWESCLDPEKRDLVQVKLNDEGKLDESTLNLFFGGNAELRKQFIDENL